MLADDHAMIRAGVKNLLRESEDIVVIGEAENGRQAVDLYEELKPDLIILDISLPDMNGMEVTQKILAFDPSANILMLSMYDDEDYVGRCIENGVKGYVVKNESGEELEYAVHTILEGKTYFSQAVHKVILNKYKRAAVKKKERHEDIRLTAREIEIVKLIDDGLTSQQMADKLFISPRTVETHRANLMKKFAVKNSIELVKKARQMNILT
ncbi:DNA-binding response regulator, NarL/FixJ family, contains REC and HTH domains [Chryseolinea serpens]|uniref:DNA-binding response regulator, NarL/FixJ family, contains REC and HTH domains n=2 Tax=Chryseolinea serpens TaxID=947013 RepID=A0A1M5X1Q2_9BACT|nr:DNA-binding response regulator, NarL/FixJ family, contains REC and HTH domains [Chryseolinea serpens]